MLQRCAELKSVGVTFIEDSVKEDFLSYHQLYEEALKVLAIFQEKGIEPGHELVLQLEDNKTFIIVFWACILGGIIPVPLSIGQKDDHKKKLFQVWSVLNHPFIISGDQVLQKLNAFALADGSDELFLQIKSKWIAVTDIWSSSSSGRIFEAKEDDIAFLQFSSGSTGHPKGVILTHQNLLENIEAISKASAYSASDSMLSWMPLTHDMGMIGFHINPLFMQINQYLIPTDMFVRRPSLWLDKATKYEVSILCSPNFGYKYVLKHCSGLEINNWNLQAVRLIYNGAEPISEKLCRDFSDFLAVYGLRRNRIRPVYGLAEATLAVSISDLEDEVITCYLDRDKLKTGDKITIIKSSDHRAIPIVNVGKAISGFGLSITDHDGLPVKEQVVGEVHIKGGSVTTGYYNNTYETNKVVMPDGWFNTGDLGFMMNGSLYITGRSKDVIFINGQNYYPHDIEDVAHSVEGVELNKIAIAGFFNYQAQKNEVVGFIFHRGSLNKFVPLCKEVKAYINSKTGIELDALIPVKDIPRTTSGKLQRFRLVELYQQGEYKETETALNLLLDGEDGQRIIPAETEIEHRLLLIWRSLLDRVDFGIAHDFFEIGGSSLRAAEIGMQVYKEFNVELPFDIIYRERTIKALAVVIASSVVKEYQAIPVSPVYHSYPVSPAQRRLYFAWAMDKNSLAYNLPSAFRLANKPDVKRMEAAIRQLITRHDSLRMTFLFIDEPEFKINEQIDFILKVRESKKEEKTEELLKDFVRPFDLTSGPLFRIELLKLSTGYLLLTDFHHIISDGLSVYKFLDELFHLYQDHQLERLPIGYKDYALREFESKNDEQGAIPEKYWLDHLSGEIPVLQMATDFPRPMIFDAHGGKIKFQLDGSVVLALRKLALANESTLHVLLLAMYRILLFKYSGQQELIVGIPVSGRDHPDLRNLQGMFVNNLALKGPLLSGKSFRDYLISVRDSTNAGLNHRNYSFDRLINKIQATQNASRNPLFDTMFLFQEINLQKIGGGVELTDTYFFDPEISKFDISMEIHDLAENEITCFLEYSKSLFKKETILRIASHFRNLISEILQDPLKQVTALQMISTEEQQKSRNNDYFYREGLPEGENIWSLIEAQISAKPDQVAIVDHQCKVTYAALNDGINRLVSELKQQGFRANDIIGIQLPRSSEFVISLLAVMKAGGVFLLIDPELPEERIKYLLSNSKARFLIDKLHGLVVNKPIYSENLTAAENLAYILYTSGTTGNPKGVMIAHDSLFNYITWAAETYVGEEKLDFALFTSVSFDLTLTSIFVPLVTGNQMIIYQEGEAAGLIEKIINDNMAGVVKLTPSHLRILRELPFQESLMNAKLKKIIVGGEAFDSQLASDIFHKFKGNVELFNEYGPTEATVGCMIHRYNPKEQYLSVPIGVPIPNTQLYVLDPYLMPVPEGVIGELYISGKGLAQGYLFNEQLTNEKFIPSPFVSNVLMYKTGDLVKSINGRYLEYISRTDSQFKINGYRIEPAEIEFHLSAHEDISDVVVALINNDAGKILSAFFVYRNIDLPVEASVLRNFLSARLPHYMLPARFISLETIPLTKNGKVDYLALQYVGNQEQVLRVKHEAKTPIERSTLEVWEKVLRQNDLSIRDNFFEAGGDSIKAVQIASRLLEKGIKVEVKKILTYQTIEEISRHSEQVEVAVRQNHKNNIDMAEGFSPIAAWFFSHQFKKAEFFNQSVVLKFKLEVNIGLLEQAFQKLIAHHDALRLNYNTKRKLLFINEKHLSHSFSVTQLTGPELLPDLKCSFNLESSLLLKAAVFSNDQASDFLFITAHHLITDGVSWRILLEDLFTAYMQLSAQQSIALPAKTAVFIDWDKIRRIKKYQWQEEYWKKQESQNFSIPLDFETVNWTVGNKGKVYGLLSQDKTDFLTGKANKPYRTDAQILLLTALALALKDWTGSERPVIEMENHGRNLEFADVSRTIGWFTAIYPLLLRVGDLGIGSQIKNIKEQVKAVPDDGVGYGVLKYTTDHGQNNSIAEVRFNYLGHFDSEFNNDLFSYTGIYDTEDVAAENQLTAKLDLNMMVIGGQLQLEIAFNKEAHKMSTMTTLLNSFIQHLNMILDHVRNEDDIHFSPSDFDSVEIDQNELDSLFD
ncbi:hypothetical protein BFS30_17155 [Pedobacter steynii]|uniref:Carrier domain-containing protein n=2 Tax=Pedobacter steynii TaxID=430522 RepID=A0A1D7QJE0_9SPHI|nr:hypothetical protein BFS30_17155 [Pedobacter steynii]